MSLDPPLVVVSIRNESTTWPLLRQARVIGASILAEPQASCGRQLSQGESRDRFDTIDHTVTESGAIVIDDASAWFEAVPGEPIPAGDHSLVLLTVQAIDEGAGQAPRLLAGLIADAVAVGVAAGAVVRVSAELPHHLRAEIASHLEKSGWAVTFDVAGWVLVDAADRLLEAS